MLVLFETPAGFALFKVLDEGKLSKVEVIIFLHAFLRFVENGKLPWLDFSCRKFSVNLCIISVFGNRHCMFYASSEKP